MQRSCKETLCRTEPMIRFVSVVAQLETPLSKTTKAHPIFNSIPTAHFLFLLPGNFRSANTNLCIWGLGKGKTFSGAETFGDDK